MMTRAIPNPLYELHERSGAEFQPYDQVQIVSTFGEPEAEYAAIRKSAALIDQPQRGILELTGKDRLSFLNNLVTNQTWDKAAKSGLATGQGVYAFLLNTRGRIIADVNIVERGDRTLLEMDARLIENVRAAFDKYLFGEQVALSDRIDSMHELALHGPGALQLLQEASGTNLAELSSLGSSELQLFDTRVVVWRDDPTGAPGYHLVFDTAGVEALWTGLLSKFGTADEPGRRALRPVGWAALNATRIEAGRPIFGIDFDDSILPHETAQLERAVSFTKGCYLGQEIVARMHARGQFARQFVGIRMPDGALPIAGAIICDDAGNEVGAVTSSTISPVLSNAALCLGTVKKAYTSVGTIVNVPAEGKMRHGSIVELPFLRR